jgi:hypothetical protein
MPKNQWRMIIAASFAGCAALWILWIWACVTIGR